MRAVGHFGISILAAHQQDVCRQLSGDAEQRFAGHRWHATPSGAVLLEGATAWLECSQYQTDDGGDHEILLLRVSHMEEAGGAPLVFHGSGFRSLS
jgi:flavin reductase (DIM6/NTAB) family NADH-FMN oxidoreductase RutF